MNALTSSTLPKLASQVNDFKRAESSPECEHGEHHGEPQSLGIYTANNGAKLPRNARYSLRMRAGKILSSLLKEKLDPSTGEIKKFPAHRTTQCTCALHDHADLTYFFKSDMSTSGHQFKGLISCGSVWSCPVCSHKVAQFRSDEVTKAHDLMFAQGYKAYLITFTMSHKKTSDLSSLVDALNHAFSMTLKHRTFKTSFPDFEYVKAQECTYPFNSVTLANKNGFHPHIHLLAFTRSKYSPDFLKSAIFPIYNDYLNKSGFNSSYKRGLDVKDSFSNAEYLTKFGYSAESWRSGAEMALSIYKDGHPFSLIDTHPQAFLEYSKVYKGKRQITCSKGIRAIYPDFLKKDDAEIAQMESPDIFNQLVARFPKPFWNWLRANQCQDDLIYYANLSRGSGYDLLNSYLENKKNIFNSSTSFIATLLD